MAPDIMMIVGIVAALAGGLAAVAYWRRSVNLQTLMVEAANRFEEARRQIAESEERLAKTTEKLTLLREAQGKLEKALDDARGKASYSAKQLEAKENERQLIEEKADSQREHLQKQVEAMTAQLSEADQMRKDAEMQFAAAGKSLEERVKAAQDDAQAKIRETRVKLQTVEGQLLRSHGEIDRLKKVVETADPEEMKRLKRKTAQYARLYISMKGLRDMAEERNFNWEVALGKMAAWIVDNKPNRAGMRGLGAGQTPSLGRLVGEALERIGAQLVTDEETFAHQDQSGASEDHDTDLDAETDAAPARKAEQHTTETVAR